MTTTNSAMMLTSLIMVVAAVAAADSGSDPPQTVSTPPPQIDPAKLSYKLSFLWPQGYCKTKSSGCEKTTNLPTHFTIHGFWPIYKGKCTDSTETFKIDLVKDIKGSLEKNWPDLKNYGKPDKYAKFWQHEWDGHGKKCNLFKVKDYFAESLELLTNSRVTETLKTAGMPTKPENVRKAFSGKGPYVLCKEGSDKVNYFYQIEFCLNGGKSYVECPKISQKSHCAEGKDFSYGIGTTSFLRQVENLVDEVPI